MLTCAVRTTDALTNWYRSVCKVERSAYRGWAVLDRAGHRLNAESLEWRMACNLADRTGARVVMWTMRARGRGVEGFAGTASRQPVGG